jgi:hypothetical protein
MWWRKFFDFQSEVEEEDYAANKAFVTGMGILNTRVDRQAERRRALKMLAMRLRMPRA